MAAAPWLMKALSVVGTAAMFLVGGGILAHGIPGGEEFVHRLSAASGAVTGIGAVLEAIAPLLINASIGIVAGGLALAGVVAVTRLRQA